MRRTTCPCVAMELELGLKLIWYELARMIAFLKALADCVVLVGVTPSNLSLFCGPSVDVSILEVIIRVVGGRRRL